ncbi:MAG TPA: hypothetical protein VK477_11140 [Acidobacteriota bacterium]|nr:hypothetical protein [Acidobacteriota bacterium]
MKATFTEALFTAAEIAQIAGVEPVNLYRMHPESFGSPGHFRMNASGATVYTERGARGLADVFDREGRAPVAHSLRVLVDQRINTPSREAAGVPWYQSGAMA